MLEMGWAWEKIPFEIPQDIKMLIQATPIVVTNSGVDKLAWADSSKASFELRSAYKIAMGIMDASPLSGKWLWKADTLSRIKTFLWMCVHNSIGVKVCLEKRGVVHDNKCPICLRGSETILHSLRDCPHIKQVWNQLGITPLNHAF